MSSINRALLIAGFHRSATSATANYLYNAGLPLGQNLMPGGISNPKGHYEDIEAVKLHDEQLMASGTSWQFYDEVALVSSPNSIAAYVAQRNTQAPQWGVKDPRACLFLDEWQSTLAENGRFLFIARHWASCAESLLHRHSREFAHQLPNLSADNAGLQFWRQPQLAVKMWLSYNLRIINFVKANPNVCLVVTQRALFEGAPLIETLNAKFGFNLNVNIDTPFDANLLRDSASERVLSGLSTALIGQLNAVWAELLALASFKSADEAVSVVNTEVDIDLFGKVTAQIVNSASLKVNALLASSASQSFSPIDKRRLDWPNKLLASTNAAAVQAFLDRAQDADVEASLISQWLPQLCSRYYLNANVLLAAAKLLMRVKCHAEVLSLLEAVVALGLYYPFIDFMMAQCFESQCSTCSSLQRAMLLNKADFFYKKALNANPNNANFYIGYAKFLLSNHRSDEAGKYFAFAFEKGPEQVGVVTAYTTFLESTGCLQQAIEVLARFNEQKDDTTIKMHLQRFKFKQDYASGKLDYVDMVKRKVQDKDLTVWLSATCAMIDAKAAEEDFIIRCLNHWDELRSAD